MPGNDGPIEVISRARRAGEGSEWVEDLEAVLVAKYLTASGLMVSRNSTLLAALARAAGAHQAAQALDDVVISSIDDLVAAFQALVLDSGGPGSVFTPSAIAGWMAHQAINIADARVLDPACGCGALLVPALVRLYTLNNGRRAPSKIIAEQLYGVDLDCDAPRRTKLMLAVAALELGEDCDLGGPNVACFDSLDSANWEHLGWGRFDVVVANPPYVRYQEIPLESRNIVAERWRSCTLGNFNLYFAFFELAKSVLRAGGAMAFITPNSFLRAASARPLRRWMIDDGRPRLIVDFGTSRVFPGAMTYTAITLFGCGLGLDPDDGKLGYITCDGPGELGELRAGDAVERHLGSLGDKSWPLIGAGHEGLMAVVASGAPTLGDFVDIRYGVATLRDGLYLLSGQMVDGFYRKQYGTATYAIEPGATRPAVKVPLVANDRELAAVTTRLVFPYAEHDGRLVVWDEEEQALHPEAMRYLRAIASELKQRDHGKKTYPAWFAYGRSQGLVTRAEPRLLTPLYALRPRFLTEEHPRRLHLNGCSLTPKADSGLSLELLAAVVGSSVMAYYINHIGAPISGGYRSYQKGPVGSFALPADVLTHAEEILAAPAGAKRDGILVKLYGVGPTA